MRRRCLSTSLLGLFAVVYVAGCGTSGGCAGGPVEPIPGGFTAAKEKNAAALRISKQGFDYINANWKDLIVNVMPGAKVSPANPKWLEIPFGLPCMDLGDIGWGVGRIFACDNGKGGDGTKGFMDAACTVDDTPCPLMITLQSVTLSPTAPDSLNITADLQIDALKDLVTRKETSIAIDSMDSNSSCLWFKRLGCMADFHSYRATRTKESVTTQLQFKTDPLWDNLITMNFPQGIQGFDGIESDDLSVNGQDMCHAPGCKNGGDDEDMCDWICDVVDWGFVKGLIIDNLVKPQLETKIKEALATQSCRKCNPTDPTVPLCPAGSTCQCATGGTCDPATKMCMGDAAHGGKCVPALLGFEGRVKSGEILASFGGDPASKVDLLAAAGGSAPKVDTAFETPMLAGTKAVNQSPCVPKLDPPQPRTVPAPTLDAEGPAAYHIGLAISQDFLTRMLYESHQSGSLCLNLQSAQIPALDTSILALPLPSLGALIGADAPNGAPAMVVLRPLGAPVVKIGEGTYDPATKKPIKPLATIELTDLRIDIYALIEDRYVRLFTIGADVKVPLSLIIEGCPMTILPALGDLKQVIVIRKDVPNNAELLAEDPAALANLIPVILGMAEPMLATSLKPIAIPDMNGFRVKVNQLKGITRIGATEEFNYLGVYAQLGLAGQCESWGPKAKAKLIASHLPPREEMVLRADRPLPWPRATLEVSADDVPGKARPMEYAWRVDKGLWSTWFDGPVLEVEHPVLALPGRHTIEVRARISGDNTLVGDVGAAVSFASDWDAPQVRLAPDAEKGLMNVEVFERITPPESLLYAYRVGEGSLSAFGPARPIDLAAIQSAGLLEVQVKDEVGLVGSATWRSPTATGLSAPDSTPVAAAESGGSGCSTAGAGLTGLLAGAALLPLAFRRRRARA